MEPEDPGMGPLRDAAAVHAARTAVWKASAELAARPLDEQTAEQMQAVLSSPRLQEAKAALRRLRRGRPRSPGSSPEKERS